MRPHAEPRCFCFGKLPSAGDFIRGDGPAPEFAELDEWIQHGMYASQRQLGNVWRQRFDKVPPARFLWTDGRAVLGGWWQSSRDAVGRRYPFVVAARLEAVAPADYALLPIALSPFFADARALLDAELDGLDVLGTIAAAQALTCRVDLAQVRAGHADALQASPTNASWAGHEDPAELLLHDLEQVSAAARPPVYSLRWPTRGAAVDISFWLAAMARFGLATPRLLLWHGDNTAPGVARAALGELHPRLFAGMTFFDREDDDAYDMGRGAGDASRMQAARARFAAVVGAANQREALAALPRELR